MRSRVLRLLVLISCVLLLTFHIRLQNDVTQKLKLLSNSFLTTSFAKQWLRKNNSVNDEHFREDTAARKEFPAYKFKSSYGNFTKKDFYTKQHFLITFSQLSQTSRQLENLLVPANAPKVMDTTHKPLVSSVLRQITARGARSTIPSVTLGIPKTIDSLKSKKNETRKRNGETKYSVVGVTTVTKLLFRRVEKVGTTSKAIALTFSSIYKKSITNKNDHKYSEPAKKLPMLAHKNISLGSINRKITSDKRENTTSYKNIPDNLSKEKTTMTTLMTHALMHSALKQNIELFLDRCQNKDIVKSIKNINHTIDNMQEILSYARLHCGDILKTNCANAIRLVGPLAIHRKYIDFDTLYNSELMFVKHGGWWSPQNCIPKKETAIIIPFRDRNRHLPVLLRQLHPILKRQQLHYRIFVIEQDDKSPFNRAKLMNVGYAETLKIFPYSCFVFHDVDLVPEDDRIDYGCQHSPMHLSAAVDKFHYDLPYGAIFGGVEMFTANNFSAVNGFSNIFWSWGGEDDNLRQRILKNGMSVSRQSLKIARYTMLKHRSIEVSLTDEDRGKTKSLMDIAEVNAKKDGLNSLQYKVTQIAAKTLFTLIKVDLQKSKDKRWTL